MRDQSKRVAFIVVGWNNEDLLEECFASIEAQTYTNIITIYVDNDSKDKSLELVRKKFPKVTLLAQKRNLGFAKGNNVGIKAALRDSTVEHIALLNSDARLAPTWTERLVQFADLKPKGALLQGTTLDYYNHKVIDSTHIFVARNGQGTQGKWRYYAGKEMGPKKVFGVNAAACLITRKFIETQPFPDLFDEAMFMYLEDVDLAARATVMGWDNYLVPRARAYHMGSVSSGKNPGFSLYMTFRNNNAMIFKNYPISLMLRIAPKLLRGDIDTVRTLYAQGKKKAAIKVVKGRLIGLLRLPLYLGKRRKINRYRIIDSGYLWTLMDKGY